jgi:hypothetical protein
MRGRQSDAPTRNPPNRRKGTNCFAGSVRLAKFFDKVDRGGEEILLAGLGFTAKRRSPQHDTFTISQGHKIWG